jgi:hypothetical protein
MGCGRSEGEGSYRFRMTVNVETLQGRFFGSSVLTMTAHEHFSVTSEEAKGSVGILGEAAIIDLPTGPIFALLRSQEDHLTSSINKALSGHSLKGGVAAHVDLVREVARLPEGTSADLPKTDWPIFVWFENLSDPTTLERIDPNLIGVRRIFLEKTADEQTFELEKRLTWLDNLGRYRADPSNPFTSNLSSDVSHLRSRIQ